MEFQLLELQQNIMKMNFNMINIKNQVKIWYKSNEKSSVRKQLRVKIEKVLIEKGQKHLPLQLK